MQRTLLVDGDIVVYRAAFGAEEVHQFTEDQWASSANLDAAKDALNGLIDGLAEDVKADNIIVALTPFPDNDNWRKALYPNYKAPRKKTRKPILHRPLREYVKETRKVFERPTLEADDVLGILLTSDKIIPGMKVCASIDKDLLQVPGRHINITSRKKSVVTEDEGNMRHWMQTLTGDVIDNYPGCPGIGPKKAVDIITGTPDDTTTVWQRIVAAFEKKGLTEDDALVQCRIARICRSADYDFSTKSVRLWTPPAS